MNIFYAPNIALVPELPEEESQHCVKVLRMREGDPIVIIDGKGLFYYGEVALAHPRRCRVTVLRTQADTSVRPGHLHIAIAPTKSMDRIEWFLEKVVEIGIDEITFLCSRHSERKAINLTRLRKIVLSAVKQSLKARVPVLNSMVDMRTFLSFPYPGLRAIGHCHADYPRRYLKEYYTPGERLTMLIGPEGDFSEEEVTLAMEKGFQPVSLGESRLRTETAGLITATTFHVINT